jgi:hypothetical protein
MGRKEVVCYHEAGHIVAYFRKGVSFVGVDVYEHKDRDNGWEGFVNDPAEAKDPKLAMLLTLVGPEANMKRFGEYHTGDYKDREAVRKKAKESNVDFDEIEAEAKQFVDDPSNWSAIVRIAERLIVEPAVNPYLTPPYAREYVEVLEDKLRKWYENPTAV